MFGKSLLSSYAPFSHLPLLLKQPYPTDYMPSRSFPLGFPTKCNSIESTLGIEEIYFLACELTLTCFLCRLFLTYFLSNLRS
ncbi:hypothetical protein HanRHA438_Chr15g0720011 [Helianthus annuus]|nr:hypothetical protein HanRHA438_Chr15g0720011 [Helianthus annuus]